MTPPESKSRFPHISKGFVLAYVLLVGLPILGVIGVLRVGRHLNAPLSVNGVWKLQGEVTVAGLSCPQGAAALQDGLTISQSGRELEASLGTTGTAATGSLEGTAIKAPLPLPQACGTDRQLMLTATVDPNSNPRAMSGTLSVIGCSSCSPVQVQAVLQVRDKSKKTP